MEFISPYLTSKVLPCCCLPSLVFLVLSVTSVVSGVRIAVFIAMLPKAPLKLMVELAKFSPSLSWYQRTLFSAYSAPASQEYFHVNPAQFTQPFLLLPLYFVRIGGSNWTKTKIDGFDEWESCIHTGCPVNY